MTSYAKLLAYDEVEQEEEDQLEEEKLSLQKSHENLVAVSHQRRQRIYLLVVAVIVLIALYVFVPNGPPSMEIVEDTAMEEHESTLDSTLAMTESDITINTTETVDVSSQDNDDDTTTETTGSLYYDPELDMAAGLAAQSQQPRGMRVARCMALIGEDLGIYEELLLDHIAYDRKWGYPLELIRFSMLDSFWNKDAVIMTTLMDHLSNPDADSRMDWLLWTDADVLIMNPNVPLTAFLPPPPTDDEEDLFADVHLLWNGDHNGLNAGVFMLRISDWSLRFLSAVLSYEHFRPDDDLTWAEQTAMKLLIEEEPFASGALELPPAALNAFPDGDWDLKPGGLMVHFAGRNPKNEVIGKWIDIKTNQAEQYQSVELAEQFGRNMTEWYEGLAVERRAAKQAQAEAERAKEKAEKAKEEAEKAEEEAEKAKEKAEKAQEEAEKAKEEAERAKAED